MVLFTFNSSIRVSSWDSLLAHSLQHGTSFGALQTAGKQALQLCFTSGWQYLCRG